MLDEKVSETLKGKDAAMVPILQARSDEGFLATEKLYVDVKSLPADKLAVWSTSQGGDTQRATADGVHARNVPMPFHTRG